ncbi:hypothetical protein D3C78_1385020 [compost metagenome]
MAGVGGVGRRRCVDVGPGRAVAWIGSVIVGSQIQVAYDVLPFELHIHGPGFEVHLPFDLAGDDSLLRCTTRLVPIAGLEVALVLEHHFLAADLHRPAAVGGVLGHAGVGVGDGHARRGCGRLRRGEANIGEGGDCLAIRRLAGDLHVVGIDIVAHQAALTVW